MAALRKEGGGNKEAASERRQVVGGGGGRLTRPDPTRPGFPSMMDGECLKREGGEGGIGWPWRKRIKRWKTE